MGTLIEESGELREPLAETILSQANTLYLIQHNKTKSEQTACPSKYPQGYFKAKACKKCLTVFTPMAPSEHYCCDKCKDEAIQDRYLLRTYGITISDYWEMFKAQSGKCSICKQDGFRMNPEIHRLTLVVDHCHTTGAVRGLLCHNCNRALGLFKDNVESLRSAIEYLKVQRLSRKGVLPSGGKRRTTKQKG